MIKAATILAFGAARGLVVFGGVGAPIFTEAQASDRPRADRCRIRARGRPDVS
jgi:hypothetical protein